MISHSFELVWRETKNAEQVEINGCFTNVLSLCDYFSLLDSWVNTLPANEYLLLWIVINVLL